jgi:sirohydrochlorin cobaltochelatase
VATQSLHTIQGEEYENLLKTVQAFRHMPEGFEKVETGTPLLTSEADMVAVCRALIANIPAKRMKNDAVIFMGHGSPHPSNVYYTALMHHLQKNDPNIFIATVEGSPDIREAVTYLKERKIRNAWLIPFMAVAGDHAMNDMAGEEKDSWASILKAEGITSIPVMKGTAEYGNIAAIWISHLKMAMERL